MCSLVSIVLALCYTIRDCAQKARIGNLFKIVIYTVVNLASEICITIRVVMKSLTAFQER